MAFPEAIKAFMKTQEIDFKSPISESVIQKISENISYIVSFLNITAVGEVYGAMLSEAQFQAAHNNGDSEWILSDGRSIAGSKLETVTGNSTVPDMRGVFLRTMNNGRDTVGFYENLSIGSFQKGAMRKHEHEIEFTGANNIAEFELGALTAESGGDRITPVNGGNSNNDVRWALDFIGGTTEDNRPRNITINWFVRIN